jgi:hypothetical protein
MGVQCNIILTYYTEKDHDKINAQIGAFIDPVYNEPLLKSLNVDPYETNINAEGNRAYEPTTRVICMRDWFEPTCLDFFNHLKTKVQWDIPETVQIYYTPAYHKDWHPFRPYDLQLKPKGFVDAVVPPSGYFKVTEVWLEDSVDMNECRCDHVFVPEKYREYLFK